MLLKNYLIVALPFLIVKPIFIFCILRVELIKVFLLVIVKGVILVFIKTSPALLLDVTLAARFFFIFYY